MNRRRLLRKAGLLAGTGLAGCVTCGNCPPSRRALGLAVIPIEWGETPTTADGTGSSPSSGPWQLKVRIYNELYDTDRSPFRDVALVVYGDGGNQITRVPVGDVTTDDGFTRETRDGGCCGGTFVTYERKWVRVSVERFPRHVAATASIERCNDTRDRLATATFEAGSEYVHDWRNCDESPSFASDSTATDGE